MKHSRETRGFSKDSLLPIMRPELPHSTISCSIFLFPPLPPANLQPSTAPHPTNRSGDDDDLPFALTPNTPLLCPPTVGGDTDLLPDLSPESRHSGFPRLPIAEHILLQLPPTPSLRLVGDGDDLPLLLRHPTAALFSRISPEDRLNFTRSDAGIGRSSPAPGATSVTDVEIEKPSVLTLHTSEVSSDLSSLAISLPPSLPITDRTSSLGARGAFNFGVSDSTSFTVSSSTAASASGGGSRQPPANPDG